MPKFDSISSLFLVGVALAISIESIRLGTGTLSNPGPALFPLVCGLVLGILGLIVFVRSRKRFLKKQDGLWQAKNEMKVILILTSMISYPFFMQVLGFIVVTLLWMFFVCRGIGKIGWKASIFISVVTTFACYYLFAHFLIIRFPRGVFGF
jgi:hypothetical protein